MGNSAVCMSASSGRTSKSFSEPAILWVCAKDIDAWSPLTKVFAGSGNEIARNLGDVSWLITFRLIF